MPPTITTRLAAAAAALVVAASVGASLPSPASAAAPDLFLSYGVEANVDNTGTTVPTSVYNYGDAPATGVTLTFDASALRDVTITLADRARGCTLAGAVVTCTHRDLAAGQVDSIYPFTLASTPRAAAGPAGTVKAAIRGTAPDGTVHTGGGDLDVTIVPTGADLVAFADDLNTAGTPVGGGDTLPIRGGFVNEGDSPAKGFFVRIQLTTGARIAEEYADCTYSQAWPEKPAEGYVYGPAAVECTAPDTVDPDTGILLYDAETGESVFHALFGRNLRGPAELGGAVEVGLLDDIEPLRTTANTRKGTGKSFADAVAGLRTKAGAKALREADTDDNHAPFAFWSKPNTNDFAVTTTPVAGAVGDTVEVPYTVVNNGPSDGAANWWFVAPTGTVLVAGDDGDDGPSCHFRDDEGNPVAELPKVGCGIGSEWPAKASGYAGVSTTIKLRIVSTPGDDGTLTVDPYLEPADPDLANNVAKLVVTVGDGAGGEGGGDGGLPVTGAKAGIVGGIGALVVALGVVLFLVARRRRIVTVNE